MLNVENLDTYYAQAHILRGVSLCVKEGEIVGLLGRNGAGKTTMMKAIIGAIPATNGAILFNGKKINTLKNYERARLGLGYVPEGRRIFRELTVRENLETGRRAADVFDKSAFGSSWTVDRVYALFPKLEELKNRLGGHLSGGEQQMLSLGRTLMTNPRCLLLDEPTEGLAPIIVQSLIEAIRQLKQAGLSILLSEQNKHVSAHLADRLYVLEKGTITFDGCYHDLTPSAIVALGW